MHNITGVRQYWNVLHSYGGEERGCGHECKY